MSVSSVAQNLASKIAPPLQAQVAARKQEIVRAVSPAPVRVAISVGFPALVQEIPPLVESACDAVLDLFGEMTISQVAQRLVEHNQSKGRSSHGTLRVFANITS